MRENLIKIPDSCTLPTYRSYTIAGCEVLYLPVQDAEYCKFSIILMGGRHLEQKRFQSKLTALLLKEGNLSTGKNILETFENYGASLKTMVDMDYIGIRVTCMYKYFAVICDAVCDIFMNYTVSQSDIDQVKRRSRANLKVDKSNKETLSYQLFTEAIFGGDHPYGYNSDLHDIDAVERRDILDYFGRSYRQGRTRLFVTGPLNDADLSRLHHLIPKESDSIGKEDAFNRVEGGTVRYRNHRSGLKGSTSIKIGMPFFPRTHPDFIRCYLANVMIGGFFGSVLSKTIREERGLTYGVYSLLEALRYDGFFMISTETNPYRANEVVDSIQDVMESIRETPFSPNQIRILQNYCLGYIFSIIDGPINQFRALENLSVDGVSYDYIQRLFSAVSNLSSDSLRSTIEEYFLFEKMSVVIVS